MFLNVLELLKILIFRFKVVSKMLSRINIKKRKLYVGEIVYNNKTF